MWTEIAKEVPNLAGEYRVFGSAESVKGGRRNWLGKAIWNPKNETWRTTEGGGASEIEITHFALLETEESGDRVEQANE